MSEPDGHPVVVDLADGTTERGVAIATAPDGWVLVAYPDGDKCWAPPRSVKRVKRTAS
jgi:hypothetical protein